MCRCLAAKTKRHNVFERGKGGFSKRRSRHRDFPLCKATDEWFQTRVRHGRSNGMHSKFSPLRRSEASSPQTATQTSRSVSFCRVFTRPEESISSNIDQERQPAYGPLRVR